LFHHYKQPKQKSPINSILGQVVTNGLILFPEYLGRWAIDGGGLLAYNEISNKGYKTLMAKLCCVEQHYGIFLTFIANNGQRLTDVSGNNTPAGIGTVYDALVRCDFWMHGHSDYGYWGMALRACICGTVGNFVLDILRLENQDAGAGHFWPFI